MKKKRKVSEKSIKTIKKINDIAKELYKNKKDKKITRKYSYHDALREAGKKIKGNRLF